MELVKCSRGCARSHYPNEMLEVKVGSKPYKLCPDCANELYVMLRSKEFLRTHGESQNNKRQAAKATAWNNGGGW